MCVRERETREACVDVCDGWMFMGVRENEMRERRIYTCERKPDVDVRERRKRRALICERGMQPIVGGAAQNLDVEIFWIRLEFVSVVSRLKNLDDELESY